jgi:hypothetical protein
VRSEAQLSRISRCMCPATHALYICVHRKVTRTHHGLYKAQK